MRTSPSPPLLSAFPRFAPLRLSFLASRPYSLLRLLPSAFPRFAPLRLSALSSRRRFVLSSFSSPFFLLHITRLNTFPPLPYRLPKSLELDLRQNILTYKKITFSLEEKGGKMGYSIGQVAKKRDFRHTRCVIMKRKGCCLLFGKTVPD